MEENEVRRLLAASGLEKMATAGGKDGKGRSDKSQPTNGNREFGNGREVNGNRIAPAPRDNGPAWGQAKTGRGPRQPDPLQTTFGFAGMEKPRRTGARASVPGQTMPRQRRNKP